MSYTEQDVLIERDKAARKSRADAKKLGRPNLNRKLTPWQVEEIRRLYEKGIRGAPALAARFGVSILTIQRIVNGEVWEGAENEIR